MDSLRRILSKSRKALRSAGAAISRTSMGDMLAHNWHLGFTAFGGPSVHFQIFRGLFVNKYRWLDDTQYDEMFALCQALSGAASTKLLFALNTRRYGFWIGLMAFFVWSLPMAITAFGLALGIAKLGDELPGPVYALMSGLNAATVGIIALAAVQLSQKAITDTLSRVVVFLGATAGMLYNALWYFPVLMMAGGTISLCWDLRVLNRTLKALQRLIMPPAQQSDQPDQEAVISATSLHTLENPTTAESTAHQAVSEPPTAIASTERRQYPKLLRTWKSGSVIVLLFFISFSLVMVCRGLYNGSNRAFDLFANLYLAGTIIFGGGPVVIPLLREYIVAPGWVSSRDFLLGIAITQAFPGPNFNFAVYLGALAVKQAGMAPVVGAIAAFLAMFTPGLWIMAGFLGIWSSIRKNASVRSFLRGIHATAVGLVFTAVYRLFEIGYLDASIKSGGSLGQDPWWVVIVATSFFGGMHFKLAPPLAVVLGAVMGLLWYAVVHS